MDDKTLAMLGDRAAQERLTERGELAPCPSCHGERIKVPCVFGDFWCECEKCGTMSGFRNSAKDALESWNTRAPIITTEQIKRLEGME